MLSTAFCSVLPICIPFIKISNVFMVILEYYCYPWWWYLWQGFVSLGYLKVHLLTLCVCMLSHFSCVRWTGACQAPLSMGFSRHEYWSGWPRPPPWDLPNPRIKPVFLMSTCIGRRILYHLGPLGSHLGLQRVVVGVGCLRCSQWGKEHYPCRIQKQ